MDIHAPRLLIDALRASDADALFACRSHPDVARFQGWCPGNIADAADFIQRQDPVWPGGRDGWQQRAIRRLSQGDLIGDLGMHLPGDPRESVEFGISIAPGVQGQGYAGEALRAMFDVLFGPLQRHRAHASVDPRNLASMALMASLGLRQEAHFRRSLWIRGEWVDDAVFAMLASEWPGSDH